ncbi:hypothetical protein PIB30_072903 [Stylosanthes scabra]|uniref:Uncharacterized protein n=1 Tax=Stylosanthes scabra TaxID=79078 RepID=A0ABU6ZMV4_9FABA|nr:hypothetical protein [Stylosanthes scabra]
MLRSNFNPNLLFFYPEIERTLRRARQVRRRLEFENNLRSQTENLASQNNSAYSSDSDSDCDILSSSDTGTFTMGDLPRITLKQMGGASMALENQPVRFPELNENFELKSGLINLLPRFHGMLGEDPIKHLKDFDGLTANDKSIIDAFAGRFLMNKTPEEAWELIESVANKNQHFKIRATSAAKGVYEVAPSESTILAKSLVDIAAMLKEIKEG